MSQTFNSEDEIRPIAPPTEDVIRARWTRHGECLVSVSMLCFNHAPFVRKALDGVLNQQTDFGFEILVHDDASTDESASIIREYAERYPNIVKPIFQSENQYSQGIYPSVHFNYPRAQSAFVAICEADDCWIDCGKLQAQVDALLAHPGIDLAFHQAHRIDVSRAESVFELMGDYASEDQVVPWIEIVHRRHGPLPTASCIIRQNAFRQFIDFLRDRDYLTIGDLYLQFFGALRGGAFYVARPMSVYRVNTQHSWSRGVTTDPVRKIRHELAMIQSYCELDGITHFAFREEFQKLIVQRIFWLFDSELVTPEIIAEHGLGELADVHRRLLDVTATDDMMPITGPSDRYVIYGAGSGCGLVMRSLRREDVAAIVDLYGGKVGQRMFDIPVVALADLPKYREHPLFVSTFAYDRNMFEHLINDYGFDGARIIHFYRRMVDMIDVHHLRQLSAKVLGRLAPARRAVLPPSSGSAARGTTGRRSQELPAAYRPRVLTLE